MVNLLFLNDKEILAKKGIVRTLYDPACGTRGMLSVSEDYLRELNPDASFFVNGILNGISLSFRQQRHGRTRLSAFGMREIIKNKKDYK